MLGADLDPTDKGILYLLQENARQNTTENIGEKVGVSSSTVANRISKLEDRGVITGYHPTVDYQQAGFDHHLLAIGTVPFDEREALGEDILNVHGVTSVRELMSHRQNLSIELVGDSRNDIEQSLAELDELGVEVHRTEVVKRERQQPFDHFGRQFTDEE